MVEFPLDEKAMEGLVGGDTSSRYAITFGAGSTPGTGEHYWDYVAYTTKGAFSPDELPSPTAPAGVERKRSLPITWGRDQADVEVPPVPIWI